MFVGTGAMSSSSGSARTSSASSCACAMFWSMSRPNLSSPCSLNDIQTLRARKPRESCTPYSLNQSAPLARPRSVRSRYSGVSANVVAVGLPVAHERAPGLERHVQPLVQVERRPNPRAPCQRTSCRWRGASATTRADGAVDVEPEPLPLADVREGLEVVDGAGVDRARIADHAVRLGASRPVRRDHAHAAPRRRSRSPH